MTEQEREQIRRRLNGRHPDVMRWLLVALCVGTLANSVANVAAFGSIQSQRADAIGAACVEQNVRHDKTIATLDALIAKLPPGPRRERSERNRDGTVLLIKALAPKRDCDALVRKSLGQR